MAPVIKLDIGLDNSPSGYNYAYIPDFNKYYYVSEWMFEERLWVAYLEEDVLLIVHRNTWLKRLKNRKKKC